MERRDNWRRRCEQVPVLAHLHDANLGSAGVEDAQEVVVHFDNRRVQHARGAGRVASNLVVQQLGALQPLEEGLVVEAEGAAHSLLGRPVRAKLVQDCGAAAGPGCESERVRGGIGHVIGG